MWFLCSKTHIGLGLLIVTLVLWKTLASEVEECSFQDTCEGCLGLNFNCAWCTDKMYDIRFRCLTREELIKYKCDPEHIWENEEIMDIVSDESLQDYQDENARAKQLSPQKVRLQLVKSKTQQIKLKYRPARNNPLDLYYLMDLTWTMRDDRRTLVSLGRQLSAALQNLTVNHRIGFGSFADKPTMPMIQPHLKKNPCAAEGHICEETYGFKHHLPLTDDINKFIKSVKKSRVTGNLDNLEGGLDALMQVIVCSEEIGWKDEARKIVLLVSDGFMHFAGDGLLAGITRRNDRKCHLDDTGLYTESLTFDYPSLEEIYRELVRRKISVIFAVTADVLQTYQQMSNLMNGISNVEKLSMDSSNILELIRTSYETFLKRVKLTDDSPPFIHLTYETNCGGQFQTSKKRNYCNDLEIGKEVEFYINITAKDFPDDGIYNRKIRIEVSGLSEYLELDVEIQKPCPCNEDTIEDEYGRWMCSEHGVLHCGMCECDNGWGGVTCACDLVNSTTSLSIEDECRKPFAEGDPQLGPICSRRGQCNCGTCECLTGYTGKYCECLECADCDPEKADCYCGRCVCKYGWSGNKCNCKDNNDPCKSPNGEICSDRGECECGVCKCNEGYLGRFCEIGKENENKLCLFYESCAKCLIQQKLGTYSCDNITDICSNMDTEIFQFSFVNEIDDSETKCMVRLIGDDELQCEHFYSYNMPTSSSNHLTIQVTDCTPVDMVAMGGFISLFTFLIGLIVLVCVVCCMRAADAREYAKFEKQNKFATLMESPLYKNPVREYKVPQLEEDDMSI